MTYFFKIKYLKRYSKHTLGVPSCVPFISQYHSFENLTNCLPILDGSMQDVIDGDLCEQFPTLPLDMQRKIADELDRTPGEILKKLEEVRNKII